MKLKNWLEDYKVKIIKNTDNKVLLELGWDDFTKVLEANKRGNTWFVSMKKLNKELLHFFIDLKDPEKIDIEFYNNDFDSLHGMKKLARVIKGSYRNCVFSKI